METPRLVSTTGYPSAGKSFVANYLCEEYGFTKISSDDLRDSLYSRDFIQLKEEANGELKENLIWNILHNAKFLNIYHGLDTILDITAKNDEIRKNILSTKTYEGELKADKYLLWIDATEENIRKRNLQKNRTNDVFSEWKPEWENPKESNLYRLIRLENNTQRDQERIIKTLDKTFSRKGKFYTINK